MLAQWLVNEGQEVLGVSFLMLLLAVILSVESGDRGGN